MNICFFSENNHTGKVPRTYGNMRTEFAWQCASDADHVPLGYVDNYTSNYNLGIIIWPKILKFDILERFERIKKQCAAVAIMQEGPVENYQTYNAENQWKYLETLQRSNFLLAHNQIDADYLEALSGTKAYRLKSLMIEDAIDPSLRYENIKNNTRKDTIIGGTFSQWYSGIESYKVAEIIGEQVCAPFMGRNHSDELQVNKDKIIYFRFVNWSSWMSVLATFKYAVHMNKFSCAAGTFQLNAAYYGIPTICYNIADTADCHPYAASNLQDAIGHAKVFKEMDWQDTSDYTRSLYERYWSEDAWRSSEAARKILSYG